MCIGTVFEKMESTVLFGTDSTKIPVDQCLSRISRLFSTIFFILIEKKF